MRIILVVVVVVVNSVVVVVVLLRPIRDIVILRLHVPDQRRDVRH